ncbi:Zinc finger, ZZ type protein [Ceratobasidium sp. AG-Ba]|nr:Zinc finger, ZZ type protein [Ceratobasidium sp. AG-Ba]
MGLFRRCGVEERFALAASSFTISYKDDDAEVTDITSDSDLTEAIAYFQVGDDAPSSSGASVYSSRSSRPRNITLWVTVTVDYDGPSLSDTASLVSLEEYAGARARAQAELAAAGGNANGFGLPPDEDAATVSSHDVVGARPGVATAATGFVPDDFSLSGSTDPDPFPEIEPPTDVFQRLRLADNSSTSLPTERGAQWLREQNAYTMRTMLGVEPDPSVSDESSVSGSDQQLQQQPGPQSLRRQGTISDAESRSGDLALERSERGKWYYTYASDPSNSTSASLNGAFNQAVTDEPEQMPVPPGASQRGLDWIVAQQHQPPSKTSSSSSRPLPATPPALPPRRPAVNPADYPDIPPEVLQFVVPEHQLLVETPERVTDCSACGVVLDSFRYVCSTCGEKPSRPAGLPESPKTVIGKGKARAVSDPFGDEWATNGNGGHTYPPRDRDHGQPNQGGWTTSEDYVRRNPQRPAPVPHHAHHAHTSPHPANGRHHPPIHTLSSPSPRHLGSSSPASSPSSSSGSGFEQGYELCVECIEVAGVVHAAESASLASSSTSGSSTTLVNGRDGVLSRRKQRTGKRHAYIEKVWGAGGWKDVEQDAAFSCSHCKKTVDIKPHKSKCMISTRFMPFSSFPSNQLNIYHIQPLDSASIPRNNTIIGARFHCAVCPSVDICANCESAGLAPPDGDHDSSHIMIKLKGGCWLESLELGWNG